MNPHTSTSKAFPFHEKTAIWSRRFWLIGLGNDVDDAIGLCAMLGDKETNGVRGIRSLNLKVIHGRCAVCEYIRFHRQKTGRLLLGFARCANIGRNTAEHKQQTTNCVVTYLATLLTNDLRYLLRKLSYIPFTSPQTIAKGRQTKNAASHSAARQSTIITAAPITNDPIAINPETIYATFRSK